MAILLRSKGFYLFSECTGQIAERFLAKSLELFALGLVPIDDLRDARLLQAGYRSPHGSLAVFVRGVPSDLVEFLSLEIEAQMVDSACVCFHGHGVDRLGLVVPPRNAVDFVSDLVDRIGLSPRILVRYGQGVLPILTCPSIALAFNVHMIDRIGDVFPEDLDRSFYECPILDQLSAGTEWEKINSGQVALEARYPSLVSWETVSFPVGSSLRSS